MKKVYPRSDKYPAVGRINHATGEVERNRPGVNEGNYSGIIFNGDCGVYKKKVVRELKHKKCNSELIKTVKKSQGDLQTAEILIEADMMDVLVHIYNLSDSRVSVSNYIDEQYEKIEIKFRNWEHVSITEENFKSADSQNWKAILKEADEEILKKLDEVIKEMEEAKKKCDAVREKYNIALKEELKRVETELKELNAEKLYLKEKLGDLEYYL